MDGALEIIIVDNASTDGSIPLISNIKNKISNVILIKNKENRGFAQGCNIGAKSARGKYLLFLNSDTQVLDKGLFQMIEFLDKNKNIGILGGKLLNPNGTPQKSGGKFYGLWNLFLMLFGLDMLLRKSAFNIEKIDWVSGACMMVRKKQYEKFSGFDEHFFMYIEDMEFCFRMKKYGFDTYFYPHFTIKHQSLGSSNMTFAIINIYKGILYFYSKHKNKLEYFLAKILLVFKAVLLVFLGFVFLNQEIKSRYARALRYLGNL